MTRRAHEWQAAVALAAGVLAGCGHTPLTARVTPHPVTLGPVEHLPGGADTGPQAASFAEQVVHDTTAFRAAAIDRIDVVSTPAYYGTYTQTTEARALSSVLDAAAIEAVAGDARGRVNVRGIDCSSTVLFALFFAFSEERCTAVGKAQQPRPAPPPARPNAPHTPAMPGRVTFPNAPESEQPEPVDVSTE